MKTGRTVSVEIGTCTTWLTMDTDRATRLMGVTPVKEASAVVVVRIQPQPVPEISETTSMVASAINPATAVCPMRRRMEASFPAQTHPRNSTPRRAGDFTPAASAHKITPGTVPKRLATASPAMSNPTINASLCAPPISDSRTRGEPAPIRTAWAGSCLSARANVGVAATTIAMPATSSRRSRTRSGRIWWPEAWSSRPSTLKKVGPYGDSVPDHTVSAISLNGVAPSTSGP